MKNTLNRETGTHHIGHYGYLTEVKCHGEFECIWCGIESMFNEYQDNIAGRVLTILDASIANENQLKAIKDLVKGEFYDAFPSFQSDIEDAVNNCTDHKPAEGKKQIIKK